MWSKREADTSIRGLPFYVSRSAFSKADDNDKATYIIAAFLVLSMLCIIFRFSAADATHSSALSEGVCVRIIREIAAFFPEVITKEQVTRFAEIIEYPVRKCAHFSEYAVLSITVNLYLWICYHIERFFVKEKVSMWNFLWRAEAFCAIYACSDELHQYFVPGRSCKFFDVCVDSTGAFFGALFFWTVFYMRKRKRQEINNKSES